jgi:hypothetical protein
VTYFHLRFLLAIDANTLDPESHWQRRGTIPALEFEYIDKELHCYNHGSGTSCYESITIKILEIIHHNLFYYYLNHILSKTGLSPSSDGNYSVGPNR